MSQAEPQTETEVSPGEMFRNYLETLSAAPADPSMRAGRHTISDLRQLLESVLTPNDVNQTERKWPLAYGVALVLLSSALLWAGIIFSVTRLI